ncbi:MAG TPA: sigma factor-like helix-turn-helix DNA-binding protein [Polyangia bacterium]|nr:sigma factor-like helix-turn-helix DNA-binding protein [Polyangia bacterium]
MTAADLERAHQEGRKRWLPVELPFERFVALVNQASVTLEALRGRPDELYLAYAAADGAPGAAEVVDDQFCATLRPSLRRVGVVADAIPDVLQIVRERLLAGSQPRLGKYDGTIPLRSWIRVVAVRIGIDLARSGSGSARVESSFATQMTEPPADAAALLAKAQFRARMEMALREELARLPPDRRLVFRLHFAQNESVESIARRFAVHRVTVARWLWDSGERICDNLRQRFRTDLGIDASDFDSLVRGMRSTMNLSVGKLLETS